ncbi:MAG: hypothetical protein IJZ57_08090 [Clostridia bacterium]|nr:hypothetical protein [Clostridia bacterium]
MYKKFFRIFLSLSFSLLLICGSLVFAIDPFYHYRANQDKTKIIYQLPYYQNVGIAKYAQYDTLITGSSMTQNFNALHFNKELNCDAVRLSFDGGILSDFRALLDSAISNNKELKRVFFGLDNYLITADSKLVDETNRIPDYLIDNNIFSDVNYLFNKDVLLKYTRTHFAYKYSDSYDFYKMHSWDNGSIVFSKQKVLENYTMPTEQKVLSRKYFMSNSEEVISELSYFIKNNPHIEFVFFAPPYSILYWNTLLTEGKLPATIAAMKNVYGALLRFENVRIFFFQDNKEMITNLDKYKDATHYCSEYNEYMLSCFSNGKNELTVDNYITTLEKMEYWANNYNYAPIFNK